MEPKPQPQESRAAKTIREVFESGRPLTYIPGEVEPTPPRLEPPPAVSDGAGGVPAGRGPGPREENRRHPGRGAVPGRARLAGTHAGRSPLCPAPRARGQPSARARVLTGR